MSARVEVQGRDVATESYRIETDAGRALVPECLMEGLSPGARPSHQEAYEWIAANRAALVRAVETLANGETPRRPFDILTLLDAAPASSSVSKYRGEREGLAPRSRTASDSPTLDRS